MRHDYNKLVRDRIPEIIRESGKKCAVEVMPKVEYRQALLEKLIEEAHEACQAAPGDLITELADIREVIKAMLEALEISPEQVEHIQTQRHAERGGFEKRLKLLWTEDGDQ